MKVRTRKKINSGIAAVCTAALLTAMLPGGIVDTYVGTQAEAAGDYYYAPTKLYDYKYDTEVNPNYRYTYTQSSYDGRIGGNRWQNGSQVPYEELNRAISNYYDTNASELANQPALYFGNFWGSSSDCTDSVQQQYTVSTDGNNSKTRYYSNNGYNNFWVAANNAPKAYNGYTPVRGLVNNTLNGFSASTVGSGTLTQGSNVALPQFDDTFIDSTQYADRCTVENGFPFDKNMDGSGFVTYSYDSSLGANRYYNATTQNFEVQNNSTYNYRSDSGIYNKEQGFYPFNGTQINSADRTNVNYGFGMRIDIPFNLDNGQTVSTTNPSNKKNAEFKFSGDDDIWVFIDGNLVLDLGGDHARVNGVINFGDGSFKITQSDFSTKIQSPEFSAATDKSQRANSCNDGGSGNIGSKVSGWSNDGDHVMTVFYMERGLFESNLKIEFTFTPKTEVPTAEDSDFIVKEQTVFENVNPGLLVQTKAAADKDVFHYTISGKNSREATETNPYLFPVYADVNRVNNEAYGRPTTPLADDAGKESQQIHTGPVTETTNTYKIYIRRLEYKTHPEVGDERGLSYSNSFSIYAYNSTANTANTWLSCTWYGMIGDYHYYVADLPADNDGNPTYTNYIFVGYASGGAGSNSWKNSQWRYPADGQAGVSGWSKEGWIFDAKDQGWTSIRTEEAPYVVSTTTETPGEDITIPGGKTWNNNFTSGTGTSWENLKEIPYGMKDPFANDSTALTGITNAAGGFNLLYGESAQFSKQFKKSYTSATSGKTMVKVLQSADLYKHNGSLDLTSTDTSYLYHNLTGLEAAANRKVADYYTTTVKAVDVEGNDLSDSSYNSSIGGIDGNNNNLFSGSGDGVARSLYFRNKYSTNQAAYDTDNGEKAVKITETFINTVKTTDLTIAKDYTTGSDPSKEFTFKISFNTIFGNADVTKTGDYSDVIITINNKPYKLTSDGEFTIKSDDTAIIRGIPVGTKYTLTEKTANTGYSNETFSISKNNGTATNNAGTAGTGTKTLENQTIDTDATNVTVTAKNALDATVTKVGLSLTKRWINADIEELKANGLQLVLQRKAKSDDGWKDVETITLRRNNGTDGDAASGDRTNNVKQSTEYTDYVWQYTKTNLLQYKGGDTTDPYTYRVLEMSQDGTSVLVASGGLYTEHCKVEYVQNEVDASTVAAEENMTYSLTNNYDIPASVPKAGAEGVKYIFTFGITAIALSGAALLIYKRKLKRATLLTETKGRYVQRENE